MSNDKWVIKDVFQIKRLNKEHLFGFDKEEFGPFAHVATEIKAAGEDPFWYFNVYPYNERNKYNGYIIKFFNGVFRKESLAKVLEAKEKGKAMTLKLHRGAKKIDELLSGDKELAATARILLEKNMDMNFKKIDMKTKNSPYSDYVVRDPWNFGKLPEVKVGWRGTDRNLQEIWDSKGFTSKLRSRDPTYRNGVFGFDEKWNPFKDFCGEGTLLYRNGQKDNGLYSVVSVAPEAKHALPFPTRDSNNSYDNHKVKFLPVKYLDDHGTYLTKKMWVERSYLYLHLLDMSYFDTNKLQADTADAGGTAYPEVGVLEVPFNRILAMVPVWRIFLGKEGEGAKSDEGFVTLFDWENVKNFTKTTKFEHQMVEWCNYHHQSKGFQYQKLKTRWHSIAYQMQHATQKKIDYLRSDLDGRILKWTHGGGDDVIKGQHRNWTILKIDGKKIHKKTKPHKLPKYVGNHEVNRSKHQEKPFAKDIVIEV